MENFTVKLYCVLLATNIAQSKQYILSSAKNEIEIPYLQLTKDVLADLDKNLISFMKDLIFTNDLELMPQLISLHENDISTDSTTKENTINVVYGFLVKHTDNINMEKVFWQEFNYVNPNKYSNLIMKVIQNLR